MWGPIGIRSQGSKPLGEGLLSHSAKCCFPSFCIILVDHSKVFLELLLAANSYGLQNQSYCALFMSMISHYLLLKESPSWSLCFQIHSCLLTHQQSILTWSRMLTVEKLNWSCPMLHPLVSLFSRRKMSKVFTFMVHKLEKTSACLCLFPYACSRMCLCLFPHSFTYVPFLFIFFSCRTAFVLLSPVYLQSPTHPSTQWNCLFPAQTFLNSLIYFFNWCFLQVYKDAGYRTDQRTFQPWPHTHLPHEPEQTTESPLLWGIL